MPKKNSSYGFVSLHAIVILVIVVAVIGGVGYKIATLHKGKPVADAATNAQTLKNKNTQSAQDAQKTLAAIHATTTGGATLKVSSSTTSSGSGSTSGSSSSTSSTAPASTNTTNQNTSSTSISTSSSTPSRVGPPTSSGSTTTTTTTATYLVTGTFSEYPSQPVCSPSMSCSAPITNHTVDVYKNCSSVPCTTKPYTTTTTNSKGQFTLHLPVDHYTLTLDPSVGVSGQSWSFDEIGQTLNLQLTANSGIR